MPVTRREISGRLVDPVDGVVCGVISVAADGAIGAVEQRAIAPDELVFPGFIDLHVYETSQLAKHGVTGYLATCGTSRRGVVESFLASLPDDGECLGAHIEGPYLALGAAGAQRPLHIRPVDLGELAGWLETGLVRMLTLAPELPGAIEAIEMIAAAGAVPALGHTLAEPELVQRAVAAGARFATHLWNAAAPLTARAPGPVGALLADSRLTLGLITDGRHLHPLSEELTVRLAGPERIALTSDLVASSGADGRLLGGDRCGAALTARMARFGLQEAAGMASLVPAGVLGLHDRGRLQRGFRADLAILDPTYRPLETIVAGETVWSSRGGGVRRSRECAS